MTTRAWLRNQARKREQEEGRRLEELNRQKHLEEMQMGLMQREVEAAERQAAAQQAAAKSAAPLAKKYMDMWNSSLQKTTGMFNQAMQGVNKGWQAISEMQSKQFDFSKLHKDLETEWENIKGKFGGLTDQAIEMAGEEMTQRRALGKQLTNLAQPDYEGAAGRAMADVAHQAELGKQAEARRLSSLTTGLLSQRMTLPRQEAGVGDDRVVPALVCENRRPTERWTCGACEISSMTTMRILGGVDASGRGVSLGIQGGVQGSPDASSGYLDATGLTVVPGFIDLQLNGAFGDDFTSDPGTIWDVGARLPEHGVTSFCPTVITSAPGTMQRAVDAIAARPVGYVGAEPLGLHLEGPMLSTGNRGVHPTRHLRLPADTEIPSERVAIVTIAPELPGAIDMISSLARSGIVVSLGHSAATASQARAAIDAGATMGTHLFNAMPPVTAREPGIAGVLLADPRTHFGFIADGHHHDPAVTAFAWRAAPDRFVIVSDAGSAAGMPDGDYRIGEVEVSLFGGAVHDREGRLAGAASLVDRNLGVLMQVTGSTLAEAMAAVTFNPSEALRRWDLGRLRRGARGDVTLLAGNRVVGTVVAGQIAHLAEPDRWHGAPDIVG